MRFDDTISFPSPCFLKIELSVCVGISLTPKAPGGVRPPPPLPFFTSKILTTIVSTFTSYYIHLWPSYFPDKPLSSPLPSFDGRIVQYPTVENLRDYLSWRQVDCMFFLFSVQSFSPSFSLFLLSFPYYKQKIRE